MYALIPYRRILLKTNKHLFTQINHHAIIRLLQVDKISPFRTNE